MPDPCTAFDREVSKLGLHSDIEMIHSRTLRHWVKVHRNRRFVPEWLLNHYGYEVLHCLSPIVEARGHFGRSVR